MAEPLTKKIRSFIVVPSRLSKGEDGFALVEAMAALGVTFVVLLGLLAGMGAGTRGLIGGRQRTGAVQLARQVVEDARAALYGAIGHDLGGDPTLATDSRVSATTPRQFEGENLVGAADPLYPRHQWDESADDRTYHIATYVTWVTSASADPYKRITVIVTWDGNRLQADGADEVRVSSLLFPAGAPPDPAVNGIAEAEAGTITVTGTLAGADLSRAIVYHPSATGALESLFVRSASGSARSSRALLELTAGSPTGCSVTGASAECPGIRADTNTDSDTATSFPEHEGDDPPADGSGSLATGDAFDLDLAGGSSVASTSTARSCLACSPPVGDDDGLAHHSSEGVGAASTGLDWSTGGLSGALVDVAGAPSAETTIDQDSVTGSHLLSTTAAVDVPAVDVLSVEGAPAGFTYAARVGSVGVTASAEAGPTAGPPAVSGNDVAIQVYDTVGGSPGYRTVTVTPGVDDEETATATFMVGTATVTLTTTVVSGGKSTGSETDSSGAVTEAEASLANWLRVNVHLDVVDGAGTTLADLDVEYDYGRLLTRADWEGPS